MRSLDFFIQEIYRGQTLRLHGLALTIPQDAAFLDVNPLEDEEEFQGDQGRSDRQQLQFYDAQETYVGTIDLEGKIVTIQLMSLLEQQFVAQYAGAVYTPRQYTPSAAVNFYSKN